MAIAVASRLGDHDKASAYLEGVIGLTLRGGDNLLLALSSLWVLRGDLSLSFFLVDPVLLCDTECWAPW